MIKQLATIYEVHNQVKMISVLEWKLQLHDEWMIQLLKDVSFGYSRAWFINWITYLLYLQHCLLLIRFPFLLISLRKLHLLECGSPYILCHSYPCQWLLEFESQISWPFKFFSFQFCAFYSQCNQSLCHSIESYRLHCHSKPDSPFIISIKLPI